MDLDRAVGGAAGELVAAVVDHRDLVGDTLILASVEAPSAAWSICHAVLYDRVAQQLGVGLQLDQLPLDALVVRERLAEHHPLLRVRDATRRCRTARRRATTRPGGSGSRARTAARSRARGPPRRASRRPGTQHVLERRLRVVGRHVEGPVVVVDLHARRAGAGRGTR